MYKMQLKLTFFFFFKYRKQASWIWFNLIGLGY